MPLASARTWTATSTNLPFPVSDPLFERRHPQGMLDTRDPNDFAALDDLVEVVAV